MLAPVLADAVRREREVFDAGEARRKRAGDIDLRQVGRDAKMPWQTDGRRWHTVERVGHNGQPCRWEGAALAAVVDAIERIGGFQTVNWNDRSVVEIKGAADAAGWFLHALTGDEWLLTLKFRTPRNTFSQERLATELQLKALDDLDELPIYGRSDRVRVKNLKGPWQEVAITVHWLRDAAGPAFDRFLAQAAKAYLGRTQAKLSLADLTPWKVLGKKWHVARKGFPNGKRVLWSPDVVCELTDLLSNVVPTGSVDWSNQQVVYFHLPGADSAWATVHTKRRGGVDLALAARAGQIALGRIAHLGEEREITPDRDGGEQVKFRFSTVAQVAAPDLAKFLKEFQNTRS